MLLIRIKASHQRELVLMDAHPSQRIRVSDRGLQKLSIVAKRDEPAVKQMINRWRQEQAISS